MSPHNDPGNEATLTVIFDTEREAIQYAERPGVHRIYDNSKHVYTNWDTILNQRTSHPGLNPWAWANRPITYDPSTCPRTLDISRRSSTPHLSTAWPAPVTRIGARPLFAPASPATSH